MSRPGGGGPHLWVFSALGGAGAIIGVLSILAFGFSLVVLLDEYHHPTERSRAALHEVFEGWARSDDYLGYTLVDRVEHWRAAEGAARGRAERLVRRAVADLGATLGRDDPSFRLIRVDHLALGPPGRPPLAEWRPDGPAPAADGAPATADRVEIAAAGGPDRPAVDLTVAYRLAGPVAGAILGIETSYHRLILALLGLSGYSLLCLGYMARHSQTQRDRIAREAAAAATLELADRTCHELGNVAFVVANERRNLAGHIELLERFVAEDAAALAAAARRAGIDPAAAARLESALRREYAERGIDPEFELKGSATIAREVCRQIAACSDYIALTVRELDGHLKRTTMPTRIEPTPLGQVVADALALLAPKVEAAAARVEVPDPADLALAVRADRRLLIHALVNLVKNAIEATDPAGSGGGPEVRLALERRGATAWLVVSDAGPGIAPPDLRRIFDAGYSTKATGRGHGLGIVRESVAAQRGVLEVSSRPGAGTTFRIGLPIAEVDAGVEAVAPAG